MKKIHKRANKIVDLLLKNIKKIGDICYKNEFSFSHDIEIDKKNVTHLLFEFDFPLGKSKK